MLPLALGTITMPAHHSVGSSTFWIIPNSSICWSSLVTLWTMAKGSHQSTVMEFGVVLFFMWILWGGALKSPRQENSLGKASNTPALSKQSALITLIWVRRPNAWISGHPSKGCSKLQTMYRKRTNFRGQNILWVKFLWGLIFVGKSSSL